MTAPAISNLIVDDYVSTQNSCLRCISAYASHDIKSFGKYGCHFLDTTTASDTSMELFESCKATVKEGGKEVVVQYMECSRCFLLRQPCIAVPPEYSDKQETIDRHLTRIRNYHRGIKSVALQPDEEGFVRPQSATDDRPAVYAVYRAPNQTEYNDACFGLSVVSKGLLQKVSKTHHPQNVHCFLHSGAISSVDDAESPLRPNITSRSKNSVVAKNHAVQQRLEEMTTEASEEMKTPGKRRKFGNFVAFKNVAAEIVVLEQQITDHESGIAADDAAKAAVTGRNAKKVHTDSINTHKSEIKRLKALIADLRRT